MKNIQIIVNVRDIKEFIETLTSQRMLGLFEQMIGKSEEYNKLRAGPGSQPTPSARDVYSLLSVLARAGSPFSLPIPTSRYILPYLSGPDPRVRPARHSSI